jgi:hypothetical protein
VKVSRIKKAPILEQAVFVFRAVMEVERDQILKTETLENPVGIEVKYLK